MLNQLSRIVCVCAMIAVVGAWAASPAKAALLSDDFNGSAGSAPDTALWTTYHFGGSSTKTQLDGNSHLVSDVNDTGYGHYTGAVTNASDFDAFTAPLTIQLDGIAVGGGTSTGSHSGWVLYGRSTDSSIATNDDARSYHPDTGMAYAVAAYANLNGGQYNFIAQEFANNVRVLSHKVALDGAPTGMTVVIDGANQSMLVTLTGTTFHDTGLNTMTQALSSAFTKSNLSVGGTLAARIALGSSNGNTVGEPSSFSVDSINVSSTAVPEPATLGLVGVGMLFVMKRRRR